jgi:hypothetical protein
MTVHNHRGRAAAVPRRHEEREKMSETLTPSSPRWNEFYNALADTLTISADPGTWRCDGDQGMNKDTPERVHRYAKTVMANMGNVDVEASLKFFEEHGGYCDCEILFNVAA